VIYANRKAQPDPQPGVLLEQAEAALKAGQRQEALSLLLRYVEVDERSERAWTLLSELVPDLPDKVTALENVLTLNPANLAMQQRLDRLRRADGNDLAQGKLYEEMGDLDMAIHAYIQAGLQARTPAQKLEARYRLNAAQIHQQVPDYQIVGPRANWARLVVGPLAFYGCLLLVQGGFNPFAVSPVLCLGSLGVLLGAAALVLTRSMPTEMLWIAWLANKNQQDEAVVRHLAETVGVVLFLAPFILLFWDAWQRLLSFDLSSFLMP
jgi:hypothetical protein